MAYNNNCHIIGRLTADPELKATQEGKSILRFSVAVRRPMAKDKTDFIDCIAWEKTAERIAQYFHKGSMIAFTGELNIESWKDNEGRNRTKAQINVREFGFCESKRAEAEANEPANDIKEIDEDDLPF